MGLFKKKKKEGMKKPPSAPMPSLPKLPDFPRLEDPDMEAERVSRLPSFPSSSLGTKFSQDTIKEAVTGEEEDLEGDADDFDFEEDEDERRRMMQEPLTKPRSREIDRDFPSARESPSGMGSEPVFIRFDKFEEALRIFGETKRKISHVEQTLQDIRRIKEKEEKELQAWENEVRNMKDQIERINQDIFSKI